MYAMVEAEFLGLTSANADGMKASGNPEQKRFLGVDGDAGDKMSLSNDLGLQYCEAGRQLRRNV